VEECYGEGNFLNDGSTIFADANQDVFADLNAGQTVVVSGGGDPWEGDDIA
jgi:hypothetical protein